MSGQAGTLFAKKQAGPAETTLVLLHGFGGSHKVWAPVMARLDGRVRMLAYDLPGHAGSSRYPGAGPAKVAARAILEDLARRGVERCHLAGHSMGGAIAMLMGMFEPARISGMTLLAPGGFGPEINARLLRRYAVADDEAAMRLCMEGMYGFMSLVADEAVAEELAERRGAPDARLGEIAELITRDGRQGEIPRAAMASLPMPVSVVWGELDAVLPFRHTSGLPAHFALFRTPDLGHMLPREAPDLCARIIAQDVGITLPTE